MKAKYIIEFLIIFLVIQIHSIPDGITAKPGTLTLSARVEVLYFHYTKRNATCTSIEKVSREAVEAYFPGQVKGGEVSFSAVNLDGKDGQSLAAKYGINGQTLVVISGTAKRDLTDKAMMYAATSPERLKAEIKTAVESYLK
jgi:hypothetical protein